MRVTSVEMQSPTLEEPINFNLRGDDPRARYTVRNIVGLDAEELISKFYGWGLNSTSDSDGRYYSVSMKPREIVMRVGLTPQVILNESYSDIRDELYRAISSTRTGKVSLYFKAGSTIVGSIFGFISKFEASYFEKLPEVQLTIICDDPMFRAVVPTTYDNTNLSHTNPVLINDGLSTSPHGFEMKATFIATSPTLTIQDALTLPNWKFTVTPTGGFLVGDVLYLSSEYRNKDLHIVRGTTNIPLVDKVSPSSVWPLIFPGSNTFYFLEIAKFNWNYLNFLAAYWGV